MEYVDLSIETTPYEMLRHKLIRSPNAKTINEHRHRANLIQKALLLCIDYGVAQPRSHALEAISRAAATPIQWAERGSRGNRAAHHLEPQDGSNQGRELRLL